MRSEVQILPQKVKKKKKLPKISCVVAGALAWRGAHNPVFLQSLNKLILWCKSTCCNTPNHVTAHKLHSFPIRT